MISYSTNWMGPVSTKWYEDRGIPEGVDYSCGRIDIYGLDEEEYWCGRHEYGVAPMLNEDWNALSDWLDELETYELTTYEELIHQFEHYNGKAITWSTGLLKGE